MMIELPLAELPAFGAHFNPFKVLAIAVLVIAWFFGCQWVDRDTDVVKTRRERWNIIVLAAGLLGLALLFLPPWQGSAFFLGLSFWVLLAGGGQLAYVVHRNGRVVLDQRVLTLGHVKRLLAREDSGPSTKLDRGQRIHLADHEDNIVTRPADREEAALYDAGQDFLFDVLWRRALVAEVIAGKEKVRVVYKIDGVVADRSDLLTPEDASLVLRYVKHLAGLNPEEVRRPQDGRIAAGLLIDSGDLNKLQVLTSGSTAGERLRITVEQPAARKRLVDLGMFPQRMEKLKPVLRLPVGLVVLSGPRESGVTTTQYAVLREHDAFIQNVHTLERKRIYELDNITQAIHNPEEDVAYSRRLQSVLRREPDVVGVADCNDRETAKIAVRAAAENRKIYLELEGKSAFDTLARLMGLVEDNAMTAKALLAIVNQRLVRILCSACRQSFKPDEKLLRKANIPANKVENFHRPPTEPILDRKGREIICQSCQGSGYVGRTGVFEVFIVDDECRKLIAAGAPIKQIKGQARKGKMYHLDEEGLLKVIEGVTSLDEIIRVLRDEKK